MLNSTGLNILNFFFLILTSIGTIYWYYLQRVSQELKDKNSLSYYKQILTETKSERVYTNYLKSLLQVTNRFFGDKIFGWKAFNRCLFITIVYPTLFASFIWIWLGESILPFFLPEDWNLLFRLALILVIVLISVLVYQMIQKANIQNKSYERPYSKEGNDGIIRARDKQVILIFTIGYAIESSLFGDFIFWWLLLVPVILIYLGGYKEALAFAIMLYTTIILYNYVSPSFGLVTGGFVYAIGSVSFLHRGSSLYEGPGLRSYSDFIFFVFGIIVYQIYSHDYTAILKGEIFAVLALFFLMPIINVVFDFFSLGITRYLGNTLIKKFSKFKAFLLGLLDGVLGVFLMLIFYVHINLFHIIFK